MNEIPEYMNPSAAAEAHHVAKTGTEAMEKLREAARGGRVRDLPESTAYTFLSPTHPNGRFLVRAGKVVTVAIQAGAIALDVIPTVRRDGDLFAIFSSGVLTTQD